MLQFSNITQLNPKKILTASYSTELLKKTSEITRTFTLDKINLKTFVQDSLNTVFYVQYGFSIIIVYSSVYYSNGGTKTLGKR